MGFQTSSKPDIDLVQDPLVTNGSAIQVNQIQVLRWKN